MSKSPSVVLDYLIGEWELDPAHRAEWGYATLSHIKEKCDLAKLSEEDAEVVRNAFIGYVLGIHDMSARKLIDLFEFWVMLESVKPSDAQFKAVVLEVIKRETYAFNRA